MNPFRSLRDYEHYVYTLQQQFPVIQRSTLVIVPRGQRVAILQGELLFSKGYRLSIRERLSLDTGPVVIEFYGYELWLNNDKFAWYDAQPHPNNTTLASTHPHHKHVPPNIKKNRIPALNMSFVKPDLSVLIAEIETYIQE